MLVSLTFQLERESEHYFKKECEHIAEKEKKDSTIQEYKAKLKLYEESIAELQREVETYGDRPKNDEWEEVCFQN